MRKKRSILYFFLVLFTILCVHSCRKNGKPTWDVDLLMPLVNSTLTIDQLVPDSILQVNPDNSLDIVFSSSITSFSTGTIFALPDTSFDTTYIAPIQLSLPGGTTITSTSAQKIPAFSGGVELTHGIVRSGNMVVSITSSVKGTLDFDLSSVSMVDPLGNIFQMSAAVPAGTTSTPGTYTGVFDLSGYTLDMTGPNGTSVNTLIINSSAMLDSTLAVVVIEPGDSIRISYAFMDIIPQYAQGYFGNNIASSVDSSKLDVFKHAIGGTLNLEDLDVSLSLYNNIGVDALVTVKYLYSVNSRTGTTVVLSHPVIDSSVNISRGVDNSGVVAPSVTNVSLNGGNSNVKQFVENLPDTFKCRVRYELNPLGNVSNYNDFGYYEKPMKIDLNIKLPLSAVANDLTLADTVSLNINELSDDVNDGKLYLHLDNGFPFTAQAQLYLMDENLQITDSLIDTPNIVASAPLNSNLICTGKTSTKLTIPVGPEKLSKLRSSKRMYVKVKFNTAGQPNHVKIYSFYEMKVKVVGDFNYTVGKNR